MVNYITRYKITLLHNYVNIYTIKSECPAKFGTVDHPVHTAPRSPSGTYPMWIREVHPRLTKVFGGTFFFSNYPVTQLAESPERGEDTIAFFVFIRTFYINVRRVYVYTAGDEYSEA